MKTKIMLASAVVLAVALVGTARPAVGTEKTAVKTAVVETAAPAALAVDIALPAAGDQETQTAKAVVQEKEKEKAKAAEKAEKEKAVEKKIVVTTKDGTKMPIVITITEGDKVQTLTLDKPLTITSEKDGHVLILTSEGKELQVLEGNPLRLEIKGGELEFIKEGKLLKVGEGGAYTIVKEGDKDGSRIEYYMTPRGKTAGEGQAVKVIKPEVIPEGAVKVVVKKSTEAEPEIVWTVKESGKEGKEGAVWVTKEFSGKPAKGTWVSEGGKAFAFSSATDKEMLEKVQALQEQVAAIKAKKMDITALEESLKKLETELKAKEEKLNKLKMTFEEAPAEFTVLEKMHEHEAKGDVFVYEKIRGDKSEGAATVWVAKADEATAIAKIGISTDDNAIQIVLVDQGTGPEDYARVVAKLKKELPEGFKLLEQKFDSENGTMTFKIAPPEGAKVDEKLVRKLVDGLKAEIKAKK